MPERIAASLDGWKSASPMGRVRDVRLPMFVIHGDKDCVVPVRQAQQFVQALKQKTSAP